MTPTHAFPDFWDEATQARIRERWEDYVLAHDGVTPDDDWLRGLIGEQDAWPFDDPEDPYFETHPYTPDWPAPLLTQMLYATQTEAEAWWRDLDVD